MNVAFALWLIVGVGGLAFLYGEGRGRRRGRHEMASMVEARYGPLLEQLEQFADSADALAAQLSTEAQRQIHERIKAMRKASPFN